MILDTNAVSAILGGDSDLDMVIAREQRLKLPVIVIGEYLFGLLRSSQRKTIAPLFQTLIQESDVLPIDATTADIYSRVREGLREKGRPIPENDLWIAALAVQHREPVISRDEHFDEVAGLVRRSW